MPDAERLTAKSAYSFYLTGIIGTNVPMCGKGDAYQLNLQMSPIQLLAVPREGDPGYDPRMAVIAKAVNELFGHLATDLLHKKVAEMGKTHAAEAGRLEVTAFLTERGLVPGFSVALPAKEPAPTPRRPTGFLGLPRRRPSLAWDYSLPDVPAKPTASAKASASKPKGGKKARTTG